jgi:hypothetical protein
MNRMKVRYDIQDMGLKISNVTLPKAEDSYVLIKASDEKNNEIVIEVSHEQAEYLQNELYEANRRRREHSSIIPTDYLGNDTSDITLAQNDDEFTL